MKVTVFVPIMESLFDPEYGLHIYQGELTREQVLTVGRKLAGYARTAIETDEAGDGWHLTFHHEDDVEPIKHEYGESYAETPGCGALAYSVEYCELNQAPDSATPR